MFLNLSFLKVFTINITKATEKKNLIIEDENHKNIIKTYYKKVFGEIKS